VVNTDAVVELFEKLVHSHHFHTADDAVRAHELVDSLKSDQEDSGDGADADEPAAGS